MHQKLSLFVKLASQIYFCVDQTTPLPNAYEILFLSGLESLSS